MVQEIKLCLSDVLFMIAFLGDDWFQSHQGCGSLKPQSSIQIFLCLVHGAVF